MRRPRGSTLPKPLNEAQQVLVMKLWKLTKGHGLLDRNYRGDKKKRLDELRVELRAARMPDYILYGKMGGKLD